MKLLLRPELASTLALRSLLQPAVGKIASFRLNMLRDIQRSMATPSVLLAVLPRKEHTGPTATETPQLKRL
jgi:hypothetical protein